MLEKASSALTTRGQKDKMKAWRGKWLRCQKRSAEQRLPPSLRQGQQPERGLWRQDHRCLPSRNDTELPAPPKEDEPTYSKLQTSEDPDGDESLPDSDNLDKQSLGDFTFPASPKCPYLRSARDRGPPHFDWKDASGSSNSDTDAPDDSDDGEWQFPRRSKRSNKGVPPKRLDIGCVASVNSVTMAPKTYTDVLQLPEEEQRRWRVME
ncbi:uncharacterized protein LOC117654989 [Pantherophis guttatus]|uniref:Uncharacterized protein LOC117654989 n=1 Tax=Pantherophis guttatus TaxID=94885 RepID=A0A6P9AKT1_PANGU|nr:uncharacterized protein LOC117654989 [Pantherophis guttatus]